MAALKAAVKEQFLLIRQDERRAIAAIPKLISRSAERKASMIDTLRKAANAPGPPGAEGRRRLEQVIALIERDVQREGANV
jgi:hypothetical protein